MTSKITSTPIYLVKNIFLDTHTIKKVYFNQGFPLISQSRISLPLLLRAELVFVGSVVAHVRHM